MKLDEIAKRISAHLKRFEANPEINKLASGRRIHPFYNAGARRAGSKIAITYVSFQHTSKISKGQAEHYLAWLDAGNVGEHSDALPYKAPEPLLKDRIEGYYIDQGYGTHPPMLKRVVGRRTAKLARFEEWTSAYGHQIALKEVMTTPEEAVRRWREGLLDKAANLEERAAQARALAAQEPIRG